MAIQQMLLGMGAIATKTYVDDIFSTYLFKGNSSTQTITNGIDLSQGGLVWSKTREGSDNHRLTDTVRGVNKTLSSDANFAEFSTSGVQGASQFNSNGFVSGLSHSLYNDDDIVSWTFRKAKGFFDIQEYSSSSSNTSGSIGNPNFQVNHDLGCVPGMILIKRTDGTNDWFAWVRGKEGVLNSTGTLGASGALPLANVTSTYFKFAQGNSSYNDPYNYIAYIFAGGESTAATARSVKFDSSFPGDDLRLAASSDFQYGTGDFTWEAYVKPTDLSTSNRCCCF